MDNPTIERAVLYDCDENVASILQKIGRVREVQGRSGEAITFTTQNMRNKIFKKGICIRKCLLQDIVGYKASNTECGCLAKVCQCNKCRCCSVCRKSCKCVVPCEDMECDDEDYSDDELMQEG